ncbi:MurR/RpiR family transcriptional regulator [Caproiciproducens sp. R1]|uniref:MurR/RpiR family transcriptional regulator n=1 Tax=Caproiciproducens sp. R1 TaxID=3435000 RepID=UPI004033EB28
MDIFDQMELRKNDFTPREKQFYRILKNEPDVIAQNTTVAIAARYGIAQSAISRFCQKIGFNSFADFRMALTLSLSSHSFSAEEEKEERGLTDYLCDLTRSTEKTVPKALLISWAKLITQANYIYVAGTGRSSISAQLLASQLVQFCLPTYFIEPGLEVEALHIMRKDDLVILFSAQNATHKDFLAMAAEVSSSRRPRTLLITQSPKHPLFGAVDEAVCLPTWSTLHYPICVETSTSNFVFCSLLGAEISKELKASADSI